MANETSTRSTVDVDAAFAAVAERRARAEEAASAHADGFGSLWLAHHWPHRYERCAVLGGRHVCRRCSWFYPIAFLTLAAGLLGVSPWPASFDTALVWLLSIPATVEFIGGELGRWHYNARRQVAVTSILALAVGRGFVAEFESRWSPTFWGPAITFGLLWFVVGLWAWRQDKGQYRE